MEIIIDTCSLIALARYYLPLNKTGELNVFLKSTIENRQIILIDAVVNECKYTAQGIALKEMPYLENKDNIVATNNLTPISTKRFDNMLNNNFCVNALKRDMSEEVFLEKKREFLQLGDGRIIIYCLSTNKENSLFGDELCIMTEESRNTNDRKVFKKLPLICDILKIKTISLPLFLEKNGFRINKI